jgi:ribosome-associated protein
MSAAAVTALRPAPMPEGLKALIETVLDDDQAEAVVAIDLVGKTSIADYMVVASGRNARHISAMAHHIREKAKEAGYGTVETEGEPQCDWVLLDAGDVIVHLFRPEVRSFYNIEKMWGYETPAAEPRPTLV